MNIQEGIKELESIKMKSEDMRADCFNNGLNAGITVMKKLDEPQQPVVPKIVSEYLNYCMANEVTLREAFLAGKFQLPEYLHKAVDWLNDSMNQNIFAQAWLFGYEIKEPLYEVIIGDLYLIKKFNDRNDFCFNDKFELCWWEKSAYQLTEAEIKAIDERFWPFAVPVEEVVEG